ncbi:hypothetical protein [Borreliella burgdorferi]|uniref:hypothetical protein n=1 Tax=Borreliella burgdorferi TaxID=139 RepID=UPI0001F23A52|nr:hypothetical protein [Borreliella burgdorferi]ADQ29517.1 conserved hypothetical protein [Borreliella burgdorferi N40]PRR15051.1 hypothetical protein CV656_00465 [Borreliella burgdorferi]PRR47266.1 hypothetical protein CV668_00465 [Borreliella burgdorferi]PRR57217.1 hypothetical protein CV659_00465 [Borreliella burgdorferi]
MLDSYYYVLSSLPYIDLKSLKNYSVSDFLNNVEISLSKKDFNFLKELLEFRVDRDKSRVIDLFLDFEDTIRYTLAALRAEKLGLSKDFYLESTYFSSYYLSILKNICLKENPFEIELSFDLLKWQFLTDLEVGHEFDFEKLIIYFLKLRLFLRHNLFKEKLGIQNFDNICKNLIDKTNEKV